MANSLSCDFVIVMKYANYKTRHCRGVYFL
jgi:hypothetical protein